VGVIDMIQRFSINGTAYLICKDYADNYFKFTQNLNETNILKNRNNKFLESIYYSTTIKLVNGSILGER
jgi:hypothetical protein